MCNQQPAWSLWAFALPLAVLCWAVIGPFAAAQHTRLHLQDASSMARGSGNKRSPAAGGAAGAKRQRSGQSGAQPGADEAGPSGLQMVPSTEQPPADGAAEQLEAMAQADQAKGAAPAQPRSRDGNGAARPPGSAGRTAAHNAARRCSALLNATAPSRPCMRAMCGRSLSERRCLNHTFQVHVADGMCNEMPVAQCAAGEQRISRTTPTPTMTPMTTYRQAARRCGNGSHLHHAAAACVRDARTSDTFCVGRWPVVGHGAT